MLPFPASESSLTLENTEQAMPVPDLAVRKPRLWTVFAVWIMAAMGGLMAVVASYMAVGMVVGFVAGMQGGDSAAIELRFQQAIQQPFLAMLLSLVPFQLGMGAVVLLAARWSPEPLKQRLGLTPSSGRTFGFIRVATMAAFTLSAALASLLGSALLFGMPPTNSIGQAVSEGSWLAVMLTSIVVSLVPAVVEEIVFRGYIQRRLLMRWSPTVAIGVSTLMFALMHADSLQHIIAVVPLGIVTGLLAWRTGSVMPGILLHAMHNAGAVKFAALARILGPEVGEETLGMLLIGAIAAMALLGLPAVISLVRRTPCEDEAMAYAMPSMSVESLAGQAV